MSLAQLAKTLHNLCRGRGFVPAVDFSVTMHTLADNYRFNEIVSSMFLERELVGFHSINSFFLDIEYDSFQISYHDRSLTTNINKWINYAGKCKVQYLYLYLSIHAINTWEPRRAHFPPNILLCTTLVNLKLCHLSVDKNFPFTLRSLKTLLLDDMYFNLDQNFMFLLAGCPALKDLQVSHLYFGESVPFDFQLFESSSLKKLNRADITLYYCYFPMKALSNLEGMLIQLWKVRV